MGNGVKVVGESDVGHREDETNDDTVQEESEHASAKVKRSARTRAAKGGGTATKPGRVGMYVLAVLAALGIAGTITFQREWASLNGQNVMAAQARKSATTFLTDLTNFNAKSVDSDFAKLTTMATGTFAKQANQFFNSSIRQELETALASSRGQVRSMYVQSVSGNQAQVYAVVDQLYVNRSIAAPQSDVLRVVVQMSDADGSWKVADVTVLEGPSLASPSASSSSNSSTSNSNS